LNVKVKGVKENSRMLYTYHLIDRYDDITRVTAMGRTTAYTASIIVQLLANKVIEEKGVVPPERLGMNEKLFKKIMIELRKREIKIEERNEEIN